MLVAAAVCPHPPLLIPAAMGAAGLTATRPAEGGLAGAGPADAGQDGAWPADAELSGLRASCAAAVAGLLAAGPDLLVVVGGAACGAVYAGHAAGSLRDFGITAAAGSGEPVLPLSLTAGAWLLDQAGEKRRRTAGRALPGHPDGRPGTGPARCALPCRLLLRAVAADLPPADCLRLGAELAVLAPRVALLAMGDASARKAVGVPGVADPAAERYDAEVAAALSAADSDRLASLDPALDGELLVAGRAAWQVLAGAADGTALRGHLRCAVAPYDVTYLVASWAAPATVAQAPKKSW